jgi:hypothetical protein
MLSKFIASVAMAAALLTAPVGLSARSCILSSAPVQQPCKPGCCANKTCCATSNQHKSSTTQPLAKSDPNYQVSASTGALPTTVPPSFLLAVQVFPRSNVVFGAHSPPTLALICIRLI